MLNDDKYKVQVRVPIFKNSQLMDTKQEDALDHSKMLFDIENDSRWTDNPSFKIAKNILKNNAERLRGNGPYDDSPDNFATRQLALFVTQLAKDGGHRTHDVFRTTLLKFYNHLNRHLKHVTYITPLYNVRGDFFGIKLTPNLYVRKVMVSEYSKIVRLDSTAIKDIDQYQKRLKFVLVSRIEGRPDESLQAESTSKYVLAINALRLFGDGYPGFGRVYEIESEHMDVGTVESLPSYYKPPSMFREIDMSEDDARRFVSLHDMITKKIVSKKSEFLHNAMNRFGMAYMHRTPANKVVDYVISLEALLTDSPGESTMKLAHRTAAISADTDAERVDAWGFIRQVYNFRSGIVHSAKERQIRVRSSVMNVGDVESRLHTMTKKSIRRMILLLCHYKTQKEMLDALDRSIYDRKEMSELQKIWDAYL